MKLSKRNKNTIIKTLIVLIILMAILIVSFSVYSFVTSPIEVKSFETSFIVGENVGFDLNDTLITFGKVPQGGEAERNLFIENTHNFPIKLRIFASQEVINYIYFDEEIPVMDSNSNITLKIKLKIPLDLEFGNYSGTILAKIYRAK